MVMRAKKAVSNTKSLPSSVGGLNARDALALMPPNDAITMNNFFPTPTNVQLRNGYVVWATGLPANVESLMPYNAGASSQLFAASGTAIYDVTAGGAVGAPVVTGLSNARFQYVNFGTTGGQYLYVVNDADSPILYNGTTAQAVTAVSTPIAITGVTTSLFAGINAYKNRLFFIEHNSFHVWYLPPNAVGGAASEIDMSPLFKKGGFLMSMMTWTIDNASGINEYAVFLSSEGEIVMYNGTDPSVAGNWVIQGTFNIGRPIGRKCWVKVGSDIIIICADGFFPISQALLTDRSQEQDAISNKIDNLVNNDVEQYKANFGWEACLYSIGNKIIVNVPQQAGSIQYQYVMNTVSNAWCRFTGWNANCFSVMQDVLYFGGNLGSLANSAYVAKADTGYSDAGGYIFGEVKMAFSYFDSPGDLKRFLMVRPIFQTSGTIQAAIGMDVDFADVFPTGTPQFSGTSGTASNTAAWNTFPWGDVSSIKKDWQGVTGIGYAGALHMRAINNVSQLQWQAVDIVYESGATL